MSHVSHHILCRENKYWDSSRDISSGFGYIVSASSPPCSLLGSDWCRNTCHSRERRGFRLELSVSVEVPDELLADLDEHVGENKKFVNRSEAIRASIRKTLDTLDDIDARQGRLDED